MIQQVFNEYFQHLEIGNRKGCCTVIQEALKNNITYKDIYTDVFYPSMVKVGELWQTNKFTVAQEHLATAITQSVMASLYYSMFKGTDEKSYGKILLTCPGNELHEMGARMLSDLLDLEGYNVIYLGANMPAFSVVEMVHKEAPNLVGISCTMSFNVKYAKEMVEHLREAFGSKIPIVLGGMAFNIDPKLVSYVGGDYYCNSFYSSLQLIKDIVK